MKLKNMILAITTIGFLSSGCSTIQEIVGDGNTLLAGPCADLTIDEAFFLHEEAKSGFAKYLNTREDHILFDAFTQPVIQDLLHSQLANAGIAEFLTTTP